MSSTNCIFCNKNFSNISNLRYHLKTSKTCINNRNINIIGNEEIKVYEYPCEFCESKFTTKQNLDYHLEICKTKELKIKHKLELEKYINYKVENEYLKENNRKLEEENKKLKEEAEKYRNIMIDSFIHTKQNSNSFLNNYHTSSTGGNTINHTINNNINTTINNNKKIVVYTSEKHIEMLKELKQYYDNIDKMPNDIETHLLTKYAHNLTNVSMLKDKENELITILDSNGKLTDINVEKFVRKTFNDSHLQIHDLTKTIEKKCNEKEHSKDLSNLSSLRAESQFRDYPTNTSLKTSKLLIKELENN